MKRIMSLAILIVMVLAFNSIADPAPWVKGPFRIDPAVMHKDSITGQMNILFTDQVFFGVRLDLDKPVMGRNQYSSKEQSLFVVNRESGNQQVIVIFKLNGPVHKWYFVTVTHSNPGIEAAFQGSIFRVDATLKEIEDAVKNGVDQMPASWKPVGSVNLGEYLIEED